ncbi:MAG: alanine--tRNA ligase-related protein, partial [Patescibacteria group bacterium]
MTAQQIRDEFTKFFVKHGHKALPSSSLIPDNDSSVLLTTAGMQQFKPYFLGEKDPQEIFGGKRVTTIQKSFRTSDIDEVGDFSHLTFFEMLGNFSFGDYWKKEAIDLAIEFLTKHMGLSSDRLWATVFPGNGKVAKDTEAEKALLRYLPQTHVLAGSEKDNFWGPAGSSGPCGPCVEIYVQLAEQAKGGPNTSRDFVEIWTLVFTEYNQDAGGKLMALPQKNIDTGLGLERLAMVVQNKPHIYATDIYEPIMAEVMKLPGFGDSGESDVNARRARVVADHLRAACFLLADGVRFSNKDQGYILRRIVRRAADQFMVVEFSFDKVVDVVVKHFGHSYPELVKEHAAIVKLLNSELNQYRKVLELDVNALVHKMRKGQELHQADGGRPGPSHMRLSADEAFTLFTTHGLSLDRLERLGFTFDKAIVEEKIIGHQALSRAGATKKFGGHGLNDADLESKYTADQIFTMKRLHSATHLLHAALRKILGPDVKQSGSDINPERLRFDFSFSQKLTDDEKKQVEDLVNEKVKADLPVSFEIMPFQKAI